VLLLLLLPLHIQTVSDLFSIPALRWPYPRSKTETLSRWPSAGLGFRKSYHFSKQEPHYCWGGRFLSASGMSENSIHDVLKFAFVTRIEHNVSTLIWVFSLQWMHRSSAKMLALLPLPRLFQALLNKTLLSSKCCHMWCVERWSAQIIAFAPINKSSQRPHMSAEENVVWIRITSKI